MLRAAGWTGGLFALGCGICHLFPGPWVEPVVLLALGTALFLVSGRTTPAERAGEAAPGEVPSTRVAR